MKTIIVAYDKHYGIGANNDLLWKNDLPADLQHFKETTSSQTVIMGLNTYNSIGKPLPNRQNIVISYKIEPIEGCEVVDSLEAAYKAVTPDREAFIIGGGQIYALAIDTADRILATEVDKLFGTATIFFPEIDFTKWQETKRDKHMADERNLYNYDFVTYKRI